MTMLPNSPAVKAVYLDPRTGINAGVATATKASPEKKIMKCGTIETATILYIAKAVATSIQTKPSGGSSISYTDAQVSKDPIRAKDNTLTFIVSANNTTSFKAAKEVLAYMGKKESVFHCDEIGAGTAFKVINNYL
jgi:3-hydroxyisobutyrate dehydrogenase-like beta-hydroxyacid dehydrogenase